MRLSYDSTIPAGRDAVVLLGPSGKRIELHLREEADGTATLLALAGPDDNSRPPTERQQGPYQHIDQAVAARRAIAGRLKAGGFRYAGDRPPLWSMTVQRSIRESRRRKASAAVDCTFDPKDVFLDW